MRRELDKTDKKRKLKIAFILPHFYPYVGGAEQLFYDMAKRLAASGHKVHVVAEQVGDEYRGKKEFDGIKVWYCPWKSLFGHPFPRRKDIERHIKWCDVVHTSIFTTAPVTSFLAKKYDKPSVMTVHEVRGSKWFWTDAWYKAAIYWSVEQFTCRQKFDVYHAVSDSTKRDFYRYIGRRNVKRVYNAIDIGKTPELLEKGSDFSLRDYFGIKDEFVFLYYGRPGRTKGVFVYENALKRLKDKDFFADKKVRFCFILGKEPAAPRKELVNKIEKDGLGDIVTIRDSVGRAELSSCINDADCIVVPSLTEGFGFSALEACQSGTPLICSDGGSLPEVVYGKCVFFRNRDAADLAKVIEKALIHGEDAFAMIPEKDFSYDKMLGGIEKIYYDLMDKRERDK